MFETPPFKTKAKVLTLGRALWRAVLIFVVLNALGMLMAKEWFFERALFNLDYVLAALVYIWISRTLAAGVLVILLCMECVRYLIPEFFFSQQSLNLDFLFRSAANLSPVILLTGFMTILLIILAMTFLFRSYRLTFRVKAWMTVWILAGAALFVMLDSLNGSSSLYNHRKDTNLFEIKFVTSPLRMILTKTWAVIRGEKATFQMIPATATATGRYFSETLAAPNVPANPALEVTSLLTATNQDQLPRKLVVVVFESLSVLSADPELKRWTQPFQRVEDRYTIESGALDWRGATLRGEVRELCWQSLDGQEIASLPVALPAILNKLGYQTTAFHGYTGGFYDRYRLYPMLGFNHVVFLEQMRQAGNVPTAGVLINGATDDYVATLVHQDILQPGKRLTYWMTLSSHFPINYALARQLATPEELAAAKGLPEPVWAYTVVCRKTLESIAKIAADPALEDCDFVIVGDHPLPVTSAVINNYFLPHKIAYLILRHKK